MAAQSSASDVTVPDVPPPNSPQPLPPAVSPGRTLLESIRSCAPRSARVLDMAVATGRVSGETEGTVGVSLPPPSSPSAPLDTISEALSQAVETCLVLAPDVSPSTSDETTAPGELCSDPGKDTSVVHPPVQPPTRKIRSRGRKNKKALPLPSRDCAGLPSAPDVLSSNQSSVNTEEPDPATVEGSSDPHTALVPLPDSLTMEPDDPKDKELAVVDAERTLDALPSPAPPVPSVVASLLSPEWRAAMEAPMPPFPKNTPEQAAACLEAAQELRGTSSDSITTQVNGSSPGSVVEEMERLSLDKVSPLPPVASVGPDPVNNSSVQMRVSMENTEGDPESFWNREACQAPGKVLPVPSGVTSTTAPCPLLSIPLGVVPPLPQSTSGDKVTSGPLNQKPQMHPTSAVCITPELDHETDLMAARDILLKAHRTLLSDRRRTSSDPRKSDSARDLYQAILDTGEKQKGYRVRVSRVLLAVGGDSCRPLAERIYSHDDAIERAQRQARGRAALPRRASSPPVNAFHQQRAVAEARRCLLAVLGPKGPASSCDGNYESLINAALACTDADKDARILRTYSVALKGTGWPEDADLAQWFDLQLEKRQLLETSEQSKPRTNLTSDSFQAPPAQPPAHDPLGVIRAEWKMRTAGLPAWVPFDPTVVWPNHPTAKRRLRGSLVRKALEFCTDPEEKLRWEAWTKFKGPFPGQRARTSQGKTSALPAPSPLLADTNAPIPVEDTTMDVTPTVASVESGQEDTSVEKAPAKSPAENPAPLLTPRPAISGKENRRPADKYQKRSRSTRSLKRTAAPKGHLSPKAPRPCPEYVADLERRKKLANPKHLEDPGPSKKSGRFVGYGLDGLRYKGCFPTDRYHLYKYMKKDEELALGCAAKWITLQGGRQVSPEEYILRLPVSAAHPLSPLCFQPRFRVCSRWVCSILQGLAVHILRFQLYLHPEKRSQVEEAESRVLETTVPKELLEILKGVMPLGDNSHDFLTDAFWQTGKICEAVTSMYHTLFTESKPGSETARLLRTFLARNQDNPDSYIQFSLEGGSRTLRPFLGGKSLMGGDLWGLAVTEAVRRYALKYPPVGPYLLTR